MKNLILNEKKYIENIINNDNYVCDIKPAPVLQLLAQYHYQISGYRRKKITELLIDFLDIHYPKYRENKKRWDDICEKIARKTGGDILTESNGIIITKNEFAKISMICDRTLEKLVFTLLVLAKFYGLKKSNNDGWVNTSLADIFKMAKIQLKKNEQIAYIHELVNTGLIQTAKRCDNTNLRVTFIEDDGEELMTVTDMRELGYQYWKYAYGMKYEKCDKCGILMKPYRGHHTTYICKECAEKRRIRSARCTDCGRVFVAAARAGIKTRCDTCQRARNQQKKNEWARNNLEQKEK